MQGCHSFYVASLWHRKYENVLVNHSVVKLLRERASMLEQQERFFAAQQGRESEGEVLPQPSISSITSSENMQSLDSSLPPIQQPSGKRKNTKAMFSEAEHAEEIVFAAKNKFAVKRVKGGVEFWRRIEPKGAEDPSSNALTREQGRQGAIGAKESADRTDSSLSEPIYLQTNVNTYLPQIRNTLAKMSLERAALQQSSYMLNRRFAPSRRAKRAPVISLSKV
ncbi:hypothetical protein GUITHDRAFT_137655 [Guillardia theta CCMP2712]|uniref:Uncharacterized protein n=1 Tax=Guillardia theta (strain CCMP2712) TaxID=905079 RepID=L1JG13_GUITC|nr:hypothetical protein GUITHDRAFT_137655 [Guillardia theta CCMP2712]EKX47035.1 hypothetical protein GUITHDRAFT_137655 [Guillardia theta CCMP2712]|eukprot:XP_005834015.1 hypothetical protein GUITHDRAFT_137655 [Guillardia theta CCMP2712]